MATFLKCKYGLINLDYIRWINLPHLNERAEWGVWVECDDPNQLDETRWLRFDDEAEARAFVEQALEKKDN